MKKKEKRRLDIEVLNRKLAPSRQRAQALIMSGKVLVNQQPSDKPGTLVANEDEIHIYYWRGAQFGR